MTVNAHTPTARTAKIRKFDHLLAINPTFIPLGSDHPRTTSNAFSNSLDVVGRTRPSSAIRTLAKGGSGRRGRVIDFRRGYVLEASPKNPRRGTHARSP
jgi:hypothetical protein